MRREEAERVALAGGEPARQLVVELLAEVAKIAELRERIEELERQVNRNSGNSSMPPSSDPPMSRQERRAEARRRAKESLRKQGGQPGHEGKTRKMAPPERVDEVFEHLPVSCGCGHAFDGSEERLGSPLTHQVWELPPIAPTIAEHRRLRLLCPGCGAARLAELPPGVSPSAFGPRLEAHIATLAGVHRLSRRQARDVVAQMLGVPISLGAVDAAIRRMSRALADPWAQLAAAVKEAEALHADETSWRLAGATEWLWVAATSLYACYRIDPARSQAAAKELLGCDFGGIAITDRYAAYGFLDVLQQQLCLAHVIRQFVELYHHVEPAAAGAYLEDWLAWASRSKLKPFVKLARTIREHRAGVLAAVRLGISNGRLEGLNSKVRLISHRSFGFHSAPPLIALIYLCCGGIEIDLPFS